MCKFKGNFMSYKIIKEDASEENTMILAKGLNDDAKEKRDLPPAEPYGFYVKDGDKVLGGVQGYLIYGALYVQLLWVAKKLRNQGYGKKLMSEAEKFAKEKNYNMITLETLDFQALDFYKKLGFKVDFKRDGFFNNSTCYYLRKTI
jgi:ribosomal protein S18 acetylase RimI-like enzyme